MTHGDGRIPHPILSAPAQRWLELQRQIPHLWAVMDYPHLVPSQVLAQTENEFAPPFGVRPSGRTGSGGGFDRGRGVLILEPIRADVAQGGM